MIDARGQSIFGFEVRDVGLGSTHFPTKVVKRPALGIFFPGNNSEVFLMFDGALLLEFELGPLLGRQHRLGKPVQSDTKILEPAKEDIGAYAAGFDNVENLFRLRLQQDQVENWLQSLLFGKSFQASTILAPSWLALDQVLQGDAPSASCRPRVRRENINSSLLQIVRRLTDGLIFSHEQFVRSIFIRGEQTLALSRLVILGIKNAAAAAIPEHAEAILHKRQNYFTSEPFRSVSPTCAATIGFVPLCAVRDFSIRFGIRPLLETGKKL